MKELFDTRFASILNEYPLAEQVAPDIRIAVKGGAIGLEAFLRNELHGSPHAHLRRRYFAIPLYLQHVLWEAGRGYTSHPDNYDRLIIESLKLKHTTFITLNYDTILDRRLAIEDRVDSVDDYVKAGRSWSLVKLHGSVNWGRVVTNGLVTEPNILLTGPREMPTYAEEFAAAGDELQMESEIRVISDDYLPSFRAGDAIPRSSGWASAPGQPTLREMLYPALSVPLGSEDEIVCPDSHVEHARTIQSEATGGLHILVIGYSGLDREVLKLLSWGGRPVRSICVVNGSMELSMTAVQTFAEHLGFEPSEAMAFPGTFTEFAQSSALVDFIRAAQ